MDRHPSTPDSTERPSLAEEQRRAFEEDRRRAKSATGGGGRWLRWLN